MARSASHISGIAILVVIAYVTLSQFAAFVNTAPPSHGVSSRQLRSRVRLGPFKMQIAEAQKQVNLLTWAAAKAAEKGMPQATMLQQKARDETAALEVLKDAQVNAEKGGSATVAASPAAAPYVAPAAAPMAAPVASGSGSAANKEEIEAAKKRADMLSWAAKTCTAQGMPQAATMQAKANEALAAYEALKASGGGASAPVAYTPAPVAYNPVEDCPVSPTLAAVSKEQIEEAEKHAYLLSWAAETAAAKGMPQASTMQQKAMAAVKALNDLKACQDNGTAPVASTPMASAPVVSAPVASTPVASSFSKVTKEEFVQAKKQADLLVWAAKTAASQGLPQASTIQAKADAELAKVEAMADAL